MSYYKTIIIAGKSIVGTLAYKKFKLEQWFPNISFLHTPKRCILKKKEEYVMVIWPTLQTNRREKTDNAHPLIDYLWKVNTLSCSKGHMGQCDCFWRAHIWYTPVHPIKLVYPWKILVHPEVYDAPAWQALLYITDLKPLKFWLRDPHLFEE